MKRHINFGSIEQFRNIVRNIKTTSQYICFDEIEKKHILDTTSKFPIITVVGTEKIHGTNASVCYNSVDGFWVQSRENIITTEKDNVGCAFSVESKKEQSFNSATSFHFNTKDEAEKFLDLISKSY